MVEEDETSQNDDEFDTWIADEAHEAHQRGEVPLVTAMLYAICNKDEAKFDLAMEMLQAAFAAGREVGQEDTRQDEIYDTTRPVVWN